MKIYHNPRCRKSREALAILMDKVEQLEVIEYLKCPPAVDELANIIIKLGHPVESIIRKNESLYKAQYKNKSLTDEEWLMILSENPILIERPIIVEGYRAVIGKPPQKVLDLI
ncbi:arsenate reductase (glutaredoxin) [Candidatus Amoebophilus asiaticus]|nr:arsenate reductase (glutaredoxin) [Candidatus Amoebophilus asiaticus]